MITYRVKTDMKNYLQDLPPDFSSLSEKMEIVTDGNTGVGQRYGSSLAKAEAYLFIVTYEDI